MGLNSLNTHHAVIASDLVLTDPPFYYHKAAENYSDDSRDLCQSKTIDEFLEKIETRLLNLHRLIKPSNFDEKVFHPVLKVGLGRKGELGMRDMATDIEIIARKIGLVLHDKIITELKPTFLGGMSTVRLSTAIQ